MKMRSLFGAGDGARTKAVWRALSPVFALALLGDALRGRSQSSAADATRLLRILHPQPQVERADLVPPEDPFVVVLNHYCCQGLGAWWGLFLIDFAVFVWYNSERESVDGERWR